MAGSNRSKLSPQAASEDATGGQVVFEQALIDLETVCARILDTRFADAHDYDERLRIQQHFKNIVTPVSLALAECKGPRQFHNHFKHADNVEALLVPAENPPPLDILADACADALRQCQKKLVGLHDADLLTNQQHLEHALRAFLLRHGNFKVKQKELID